MPVDLTVTSGIVADSSQADKLISEKEGQYLLADRAYDTNYVLDLVASKGLEAVISAMRNRKKKREDNQEVYGNRYQVEKTFLKIKRWWGIATQYAKNTTLYTAAVQIMLYVPLALPHLTTSPKKALELLCDHSNGLYVNIVSVWEVALKHIRHPDKIPMSEFEYVNFYGLLGFNILPLKVEHMLTLHTLPENIHKDLFDRSG